VTTSAPPDDDRPSFEWNGAIAIAVVVFVAHIVVNATTPYGIHRDELLYAAMGNHLRLFRMDFPPAIAIMAVLERFIGGDSLVSLRMLPAIAGAAITLLAMGIARELGGGRFAQLFTAIACAMHPLFLRPSNLFQPVVFDQLWWTAALFALARFERTRDAKWWTALGIIGGLGLLNKFSILFFGFGLLIALLIVDRTALRTWGPWRALAISLVIGSPSLIGQIQLGWPVVSQMEVLKRSQLTHVSFGSFLSWQMLLGPLLLVAIAGAVYLLRAPEVRRFRILAAACLATFATLFLLRGKGYYVGPIYPALIAGGAVWLGRTGPSRAARVGRASVVAAVVLYGTFLIPLSLPILDPPVMQRYAAATHIGEATRTNRGTTLRLPQDYADMLGWTDRVALVAHVYDSLPAEKRAKVVLAAENYGEAGALEFYGPKYGLPAVVSAAGSFWFFGPGEKPGEVVITLGVDREDLEPLCGIVTPAGRITNEWTVEEEQDITVYICEQPKLTMQALWPRLAGRN
jgi:hypothetical protein